MEKRIINFKASGQSLQRISGIVTAASDTVRYFEARFVLDESWEDFDSVRAIWVNGDTSSVRVLNHGVCEIPSEVLTEKNKLKVNLVGSTAEGGALVDRLTTFQCPAFGVTAKVPIDSPNPPDIPASQVEQFAEIVRDDADRADAAAIAAGASAQSASESMASASASETAAAASASNAADSAQASADSATASANSAAASASSASQSQGYAQAASESAGSASGSADRSLASAQDSASSATDSANSATASANSASASQTFANNAGVHAHNAEISAQSAANSAGEAEQAKDTILGMRADATTLPEGSDATASYSDGLLTLGIPRGDKGNPPNLSIGTVETLDPDEDATATISGTAENPVLSFGIPKGDTGEVSQAELDEAVTDLKSEIGKSAISQTITVGKMADADTGAIVTSNSYATIEASVGDYKALHILTHTYSSAGINFYDSGDGFISSVKNTSTADNYLFDDVVDVPDGAVKVVVSCLIGYRLNVVIDSTVMQDYSGLVAYVDRKDSETDAKSTAKVNAVSADLTEFENAIAEYANSQNKYNRIFQAGYYVNQANGTLGTNDRYAASGFIKISNDSNKIVLSAHTNFDGQCRYALYSAADETTYIRGAVVGTADVQYDNVNNHYYTVIDVTGAKYIRFSMSAGNFAQPDAAKLSLVFGATSLPYAPYVEEGWKIKDVGGLDVYESSVVGFYPSHVTADTLASGSNLKIAGSNSIKKNKVYHFRANIDSNFDTVYLGHGEGEYSLYFRITNTELAFMTNGSVGTSLAHGLTLDTYIDVLLIVGNKNLGTIIINTLGGTYTRTVQVVNGYKGEVFMRPSGCSLTNAYVGFSCSDFRQPIWMFGDSYFTHTSNNRWPYWLVEWGFDRCLLNAFPGENSTEAMATFISFVPSCGVPRYAVWCLGMNDPDGSSSINASWKATVEQFILICEQNGITPILATIPNVPNYSNYYKNQYVRESGYRYIDFAKAVGAEEVGSHWYDGALSTDNVHPSEIGARILCLQAIEDVPELTLGNI